jgi:hypothetical protein
VFDVARAREMATASVLTTSDLPGEGWVVVATTSQSLQIPDSWTDSSCGAARADIRALNGLQLGVDNSASTLRRSSDGLLFAEDVTVTRADGVKLDGALRGIRDAVSSRAFIECFALQKLTAGPAPIAAPRGGVGIILENPRERDIFYWWSYSNSIVYVAMGGPANAVSDEVVQAVIKSADDKLTHGQASPPR